LIHFYKRAMVDKVETVSHVGKKIKKVKKKVDQDTAELTVQTNKNNDLVKKKKKRKVESDLNEEDVAKPKKAKIVKAKGKENEKKKKFGAKSQNNDKQKPTEKLSKKEEREKQRKLKGERRSKKIAAEGVYELGVQAKKVWNEVREDTCPQEKKDKLIKELHSLIKGNVKKIIFAHDTVRVVECLMAIGSEEVREALFQEMKEDILEMSKSSYASFFVKKLLKYGTKEQRAFVFKQMEGRVAKLMKHKLAGFVVEMAYNDYANAAQRNCMLQEFLGPEYRLFKEPEIRTVSELLEKHPEKKDEMVKNLATTVEVLIQKGTFNHSLVHTVIHNYLAVAEKGKRSECIEQLREAVLHMIHSRDGAMAGLICIWHGTPKDRKAIIKSFKTHVTKIAMEEYGHLVLLAIFDCVDDTKLVGKAILGEIAENMNELATNKYGVRVIKYLMAGRDTTYTGPDTLNLLKQGDGNEHSKKDASVRHSELVSVAAGPALSWVSSNLTAGLYDPPTTITFTAVINHAPPSPHRAEVFTALAAEAVRPFVPGDAEPNIVEAGASCQMLKKIIQKDKERGEDTFSKIVLDNFEVEGLEAWVTCNRGAFLFVNMLETEVAEVVKIVKEKLGTMEKTLKREKTKGAEVLTKKLNA